MYQQIKLANSPTRHPTVDTPTTLVLATDAELESAVTALPVDLRHAALATLDQPSVERTAGQATTYRADPSDPPHLILHADGEPGTWLQLGAALVRASFASKLDTVRVLVDAQGVTGAEDAAVLIEAMGAGAALGRFDFDAYKGAVTRADDDDQQVKQLTIQLPMSHHAAFEKGLITAEAANQTRTLQATPPNVADPAWLEKTVKQIAEKRGIKFSVVTAAQAKKLSMGGLLGVGGGSKCPPRILCMEWVPRGTAEQAPSLVVGKAVTFDTGGYNLKSTGGKGMKYDKSGGMAVVGILQAAADLQLKQRVIGLIPCAENMVSQDAFRPDDILTMSNGVTVEVTNTDAEGRLILADALHYGIKKYKPARVFDLATLTGAVVVALGDDCAGAICNDATLLEQVQRASASTAEKVWQLPLWESHRKLLKSQHADIVNSGPRKAGTIVAAAFLSHFIGPDAPKKLPTGEDVAWCHLDIAGTANTDENHPVYGNGPTGYGVRLVVEAIRNAG